MAVETLGAVFNLVSVAVLIAVPVHLFRGVAFVALKIFFFVDIRRNSCVFSEILLFYTTAVTGGADLVHRRFFLKEMGLQKPSFDGFRAADMALAAAAVAATTMRCSGFSEFVLQSRIRPEALFGNFLKLDRLMCRLLA
jgi:hypothetical protein